MYRKKLAPMTSAKSGELPLPDFIGVGPPRTATTWLHQALKGCACLPEIKETNFFLWQYHRGLDWYVSLFGHCAANIPIGEFDPNYFAAPEACERIASDIPDCKIIITLRDPVERLYSHYRKGFEQAHFRSSFEETLKSRPDLLDWSRYAGHVRRWLESFGPENVLVLVHDQLKRDPQSFLNAVTQFIGIDPIPLAAVPSASHRVNVIDEMPRAQSLALLARKMRERLENKGGYRLIRLLEGTGLRRILFGGGRRFPPIQSATEARLRREFEPEIEKLEQLLGYNLPQWRNNTSG